MGNDFSRRKILRTSCIGAGAAVFPGVASANSPTKNTQRWDIDIDPQLATGPKRLETNEDVPRVAPDLVDHVLVTVTDTKRDKRSRFIGTVEDGELKTTSVSKEEHKLLKQSDPETTDIRSIPGRLPEAPDWVDKWNAYIFETGDWCWAVDGYEAGKLNHLMTGATIDATESLTSIGGGAIGSVVGTLIGSVVGPEGSAVGDYVGGMIGAVVGALLSAGWDTDSATFAFVDQDVGYWVEKAAIRAQFSGEYNDKAPNNMIPVGIYPGNHIVP